MAKVGDIYVFQATETAERSLEVTFREVAEVNSHGVETAGKETTCVATPDELAEAKVDTSDPLAVIAYLGRDLLPKVQPTKRTDLMAVPVNVDAIAAKEAERAEAIEAAKAAELAEATESDTVKR